MTKTPKDFNQEFVSAFGNRVRELRTERGMTQEALSDKAGMEPRQLRRIEQGEINTTINTAFRLAQAFDIDVRDLF